MLVDIQTSSELSVDNFINKHPVYSRLHDAVKTLPNYDSKLIKIMLSYVECFCKYYGITYEELENLYSSFIKRYDNDLSYFENSGNYPYLDENFSHEISDLEYEAALLWSPIISTHRYKIMHLVYTTKKALNNILVIGAGPGLEIELLKDSALNTVVVETNPSEFFKYMHPDIKICGIHEKEFSKLKFDRVYAIELLEHVHNPHELVTIVEGLLVHSGHFIATTATNIPQFDHVVNFDRNPINFLIKLNDLGFRSIYVEDIPHHYFTSSVRAANTFFIFKKDGHNF